MPKNISTLLRKNLPWIFCALIFYILFRQIHPSEVWQALQNADLLRLTLYGIGYFAAVLFIDLFALNHFINRFATTVTFKEMFLIRGVTYLMMILNYAASQGVLALYLKKTHNASASKTFGIMTFITLADLILIVTSALIALTFSDPTHFSSDILKNVDLRKLAFMIIPFVYFCFALWILFWKNTDHPFVQKLKRFKMVRQVLEHNLFLIFRDATLRDYITLFLWRSPLLVVVLSGYGFAIMAFHSHIDWSWIYLFNPILMFVGALPLTPAGLGTGQVLAIAFFKNVITSPLFTAGITTPENILFTSSLVWNLLNQALKASFGSICFLKSQKRIWAGESTLS